MKITMLVNAAIIAAVNTAVIAGPILAQSTLSPARFVASAECEPGELTPTRNPLPVPSGGSAVLHFTDCNASAGDRMAAYISQNATLDQACIATDTTRLAANGDGGSDPGGGDLAVIAGSTPCPHDMLEITDVVTGAVAEVSIRYY